jgi:hypothetical protein
MSAPTVPPVELIDGDVLLKDVRSWFGRYILTMTEADLDLLALFTAHTHLAVECYTTPRLQIDSPVPECGKTTVIEHLARLCLQGVQVALLPSPALVTRMIDAQQCTILIDEADRSLDPKKEGIGDLIAVLNSGYKRGATRPVLVPKNGDWTVKQMPTFAAVVMAGNDPKLPDDTRSRIIRILLLRDVNGTVEETDWELIEQDAIALHEQLAAWADQVRDQVRANRPEMPDGIVNRFREKWSPLKRIAKAAGGDWAAKVDELARHDKQQHEMDRSDGLISDKPHVVLLRHTNKLWPDDRSFLPTEELIAMLEIAYPSVWGKESSYGKALTPQRLGNMLGKSYRINSGREGHGTPRGYFRGAFTKAWHHMGITPSPQTGSTGSAGESGSPSSPVSPPSPVEPVSQRDPWSTP